VAKFAVDGFPFADIEAQQYAISSALICSGIFTILNIIQIPIPGTQALLGRQIMIGTGVLSVMGTSFTFLPIFEIAIAQMKAVSFRAILLLLSSVISNISSWASVVSGDTICA
jgi:NCS2 family nucleobase:cation symporter-2